MPADTLILAFFRIITEANFLTYFCEFDWNSNESDNTSEVSADILSKKVLSDRAQSARSKIFRPQAHLSYLVVINACDPGPELSYLVAINAWDPEKSDKDKCLDT